MKKFNLITSLLIIILTGCIGSPQSTNPSPQDSNNYPWWNETVFYEIFVRSFRDSDGDGVGDFNGVTEKLDYLQELGIKGVWLMPINPSPSYHGYDVTDYYAVNPDYGTMEDFKHLLEEAHKRDIRIIIDLVMNHTSSKNPWFQNALTPGGEYHDWYKWSETDPDTPGPWGAKAWHLASNGQYYYAIFWDQMPDLNYDNPAVRDEIKKVTSFWLKDVGIDGFRLDAARYLVEDEKLADSTVNHAFFQEWGTYYREVSPSAFAVGEIWTENYTVSTYIKNNNEFDSAFNFDLSGAILKSINEGNNSTLDFTLKATTKLFPQQNNSNFLTNHDMPRVMDQLGKDEQRAKIAAGILLTAPGIPFIYYGEEIGMSGTKPDELIRTPMQWTGATGAGFTASAPWEAVNSDNVTVNVAAQSGDSSSLLEYYRALIQLRNIHSALRIGKTYVAEPNSNKVVAYLRASTDETILVLFNIDDQPVSDYGIDLSTGPLSGDYKVLSLLGDLTINPLQANDSGGFDVYVPLEVIPAYSLIVMQLTK